MPSKRTSTAERLELERRGTAAGAVDLAELEETGTSAFRPKREAPSAVGSAALGGVAGVGMGAVFGGPVGIALGGLTGIVNYMQQKGAAAQMAEWENGLAEIDERTSSALASALEGADTQEDRDQIAQRAVNWKNTMTALRQVGPERGGQVLGQLATQGGLDAGVREELGEMEARKQKLDDDTLASNRGVVTENGRFLRGKVEALFDEHLQIQQQMGHAHQLLADPATDVNHPFVQAELAKLLQQTKGNMLTNSEDMTDALRGAGGAGFFGTIAQVVVGTMKAEDMKFSRDEWRALLAANESVTLKRQAAEREAIYGEAAEHAGVAARYGIEADPTLLFLGKLKGAEDPRRQIPGPGGFGVGVEGVGDSLADKARNVAGARPTNGGPQAAQEPAGAPGLLSRGVDALRRRAREVSAAADARRAQEAATAAEWEAFERQRAELNAAGAAGGLVER
jgi:hypothetical protein